jgi:hypothetical protein
MFLVREALPGARVYDLLDSSVYTTSNFEVDFIVGDHTAIEVKATEHVSADDLRGLRALAEEGALRHYLCVSLERRRRAIDGIVILPYAEFLDGLWGGEWH